ncbi:MAG: ATP-binding cassette domain-containing protein [Candidatus Neomarinimicrobiota bacterium]|tara:strand:+ start:152 stop:751 length:600 start_codon:yes stop_codon:yes gene_type:complete
MLQVINLSKSFSQTSILKNVHFELELGKICVIVGSNGSGKTTFLKCLSGLMNYDSGSIDYNCLNGHLFLSDKLNIFGDLTIEENLKVVSNYHFQNYDKIFFNESLKTLNIEQFKDLPLKFLSRGNLQRNKLCIAMNLNWDYLLIDEPFSNLDREGIKIFNNVFEDFKSKNKSIIYSTHENIEQSSFDSVISVEDFKEEK